MNRIDPAGARAGRKRAVDKEEEEEERWSNGSGPTG